VKCRLRATDRDYIVDAYKGEDGKTYDKGKPWKRANPKIKMSKKQRRKLRKEQKEKVENLTMNK
jgi:phage terminase large subunit-like protein